MLTILASGIGTGKSASLLNQYRQKLQELAAEGKAGRTIWISPTRRLCQQVLEELLTESFPACFRPGIMTFDDFAEAILRGAGISASLLTKNERRMLLREVIHDTRQKQQLKHFQHVAGTRGFLNLLSRFIAELKRDETWPEQIRAILEQGKFTRKDHELCLLYEQYQHRLQAGDRYDAEGRFWLVRKLLAEGEWSAFPQLELAVVDGFTDFTATQYEVLSSIGAHAGETRVSFSIEYPLNREDLFMKPTRAQNRLAQTAKKHGVSTKQLQQDATGSKTAAPAGLNQIATDLFRNPRQVEPVSDGAGLKLVAASGSRAEIREIARRVKSLLLKGIPPTSILVTSRDVTQVAHLIEEIWIDAGIPFAIELPRPVTAVPLIKAIMGLLQLLVEDWRYPAVKKLLRAGSVYNPEAFPRVNEILTLLRQLNWRGSRSELLDDLQLMRSRCEPESEHEILLQSALNLFEMLDHLCQKFPQRASCQEFTQHLLAFARETFFCELNPALESAREQNAEWDLIVGMFHDASNFQDELSGSETRELSREDYLEWIEDQCLTQQIAATRAKPQQVAIVNANDARHMRVDHLFVMNLQEGVFPSSAEHQPFYTERERSQWNELGIPLDQRSSHYYDEMQFFYRLLTRAQRSLTLSYSYVSTSGQPLYASPFYQAVQSLFVKAAGIETRIDQLSPLPERNELLTQSDLRIFGMSRMHLGEAGLMRFLWESESSRQTIENVLGAVRMNAARFEQHGFTAYEGLLENSSIQDEIGEHYHTRYPFSASQLERYSSCPFRFFLERILQLESIESPRLRTDSRRRGVVIHDLLATLHQPEETEEQPEQSLGERFSQLIQERYQRSLSHNELQNVLLEVEQRLLTEWADLYEENHGLYEALFDDGWEYPFRPEHHELAFGGDAERETSQKLPAVPFGPAENPVYVEGRIDRIDVTTQGEQTYFSLIDYKTGALPDVSDKLLERGIALQLTLYTIAIVRLELLGPGAVPWQIGYWDLKEKGFQRKMTNLRKKNIDPLGQEFVDRMSETLDRVLPEIISRLRKAEFPVISFDHQCTAHCPYHMTCRINQVRAVAEPLEKRWGWITESEETKQLEQ